MNFDVLIVGAGPAGASAAVALGQRGARNVLLLDRSTFPRHKTCGSGLSPNALALGEELGIGPELRRLANPVQSVRLVTRGGREMTLASNAAAVVLLRRDFDNLLVERARALGIEFQGGVHVTEAIREDGRVVGVRTQDGRELRARLVLFCDGSHSIFAVNPRPKTSISTLMGWWEGAEFVPGQLEMVFARSVAPLYGWLFPETDTRVNIGICVDAPTPGSGAPKRDLRQIFAEFLRDHYQARLSGARQLGKLQGHPIVYTTWIEDCTTPGALYVGEAARVTNNATGEGISHAMQSGVYAAEAVVQVLDGRAEEAEAWSEYTRKHRKRFTPEFVGAHALRKAIDSPLLDRIASAYNQPFIRRSVVRLLGSALAGSSVQENRRAPPAP
jgi:geranylgeranyl reductase family protein